MKNAINMVFFNPNEYDVVLGLIFLSIKFTSPIVFVELYVQYLPLTHADEGVTALVNLVDSNIPISSLSVS